MVMLVLLCLLTGALIADSSVTDDYDYEYRGKSPIDITGNIEMIGNTLFKGPKKQSVSAQKEDDKIINYNNIKDIKENEKIPFNSFKFSSAKIGITLQKLFDTSKAGVQFGIKANPGSFEVDSASLYMKDFFPKHGLKLSMRAGYTFGADKKMETLGHATVAKNSNLYSMPDYLIIQNVITSSRLDTTSSKAVKIILKAKKILCQHINISAGISYCPKSPSKGGKLFQKSESSDILKELQNHIGVGLRLKTDHGDWKTQSSLTFAIANRPKFDKAELNKLQGFGFGKAVMYKSFGFGMNVGVNLNSLVKKYNEMPEDILKSRDVNASKANGGYVVCPTMSFYIPSGSFKNTEFYVSYLYGNRKTAFIFNNQKNIEAKSKIISMGVAFPVKNMTFGTKIEFMKFDNKAYHREVEVESFFLNKDSYEVSEISNKWITALSFSMKVKASFNAI